MNERLKKMIEEKEARKAELVKRSKATEEIKELRSINDEIEGINKDITELRAMMEEDDDDNGDPIVDNPEIIEERAANGVGPTEVLGTMGFGAGMNKEERNAIVTGYEKRSDDLRGGKEITMSFSETPEERAVTTASNLLIPTHQSQTMNKGFNQVSSLVTKVNSFGLQGGNSYSKAFEVSIGEGDYTGEGEAAHSTEPTTDYVDITRAKITAYAEVTEEVENMPKVAYLNFIQRATRQALMRKLGGQIVMGAGGANALVGLLKAPAKVIPDGYDVELSKIDEDTLDKIVFAYGGDENIEGGCALILSKADLGAFAAVRLTDGGKKAYKIKFNKDQSGGTISSEGSYEVEFVINSACPTLSKAATPVNTLCMAYGKLQSYEMPVFDQVKIKKSTEYKFKEGMLCIKATAHVGGNVTSYKGFMRIKKVAAV